mmetsp:Transcript_5535/g.15025  ORF Transcript_5535/g.15025 Transcript_5535/m.15025 type:complete len:207 (-) Transcript_5535:308-928(-)|eukprot:CAMPEP_0198116600 /NCGR_PEP_ID=MMETSP1442-20131203/13457_1 /TAXON_ID= /ORGANISM="Craspedostauros australis, Strain CCMP3328" /LENGTH=206 /DNA_ID=CAMNT_0043774463 /DNA_START=161 /DNA_END=781 /DNA_ORIENTATION=+
MISRTATTAGLLALAICVVTSNAFSTPGTYVAGSLRSGLQQPLATSFALRMAADDGKDVAAATKSDDPMAAAEEEELDEATREAMEKARRADELRAQEVFMKKSTGVYACTNCDWEYDEAKGDSMMIGGMIKPGTEFKDLPADWRCPVCRASKDAFEEVVEEIPGFEVNQGYGFGTNAWSSGQKNAAIFGGLAAFFLLFLSGYALS